MFHTTAGATIKQSKTKKKVDPGFDVYVIVTQPRESIVITAAAILHNTQGSRTPRMIIQIGFLQTRGADGHNENDGFGKGS